MIPVKLDSLSVSNVGFVLMLKSDKDERTLPIFVGLPEAQSIALFINKVDIPRPMTHDLIKNLLDALEGRLDHVEVCELRDGTFYGKLAVTFEGRKLDIDSRPSDAVALALRCHAPILVAESVMDEAGVAMDSNEEPGEEGNTPVPLNHTDRLRAELEKAISEERYEEAAKIRDELRAETAGAKGGEDSETKQDGDSELES